MVFERGIRALTHKEVQNMSAEWLKTVARPSYLVACKDRTSEAFRKNMQNLSPADHINLIVSWVTEAVAAGESLYPLAWSFWE